MIVMVHTNIRGNTMGIGEAVKNLLDGRHVARAGWNGRGMWLLYASGGTFDRVVDGLPGGDLIQFVVMKTAQDEFVPWLCSQSDLLATDWEVIA